MVTRRNAEGINDPEILIQAYRATTVAEKTDDAVRWVIFKTHQLKVPADVRPLGGTDPGPAGFDWVEIDLKQTH